MKIKLISQFFSLLVLIVAFKFSFDAWASGSLIQSFGTFFVGFISLAFFMALIMIDSNDGKAGA